MSAAMNASKVFEPGTEVTIYNLTGTGFAGNVVFADLAGIAIADSAGGTVFMPWAAVRTVLVNGGAR